MKRTGLIVLLIGLAAGGIAVAWWYFEREKTANELALFGNVDLRQVEGVVDDR